MAKEWIDVTKELPPLDGWGCKVRFGNGTEARVNIERSGGVFRWVWPNGTTVVQDTPEQQVVAWRRNTPKPAIPEGWTSAGEPPDCVEGLDFTRNVQVMRKSGKEGYAWFCDGSASRISNSKGWYWIGGEFRDALRSPYAGADAKHVSDVLCWRDLPPAPPVFKVGQRVKIEFEITNTDTEDDTCFVRCNNPRLGFWISNKYITPAED